MCNNPVHKKDELGKIITFPCGGCLGCRIDSMLLWQARCTAEYVRYRSAFVTFTYDENHLYYKGNGLFPSLYREDIHKYIDSLRHRVKKIPVLPYGCIKDFKYLAVGEYGDTFHRPHYHVLFFGLDFKDMQNIFCSSWSKGYVKVLPLMSGGVRYVLDYMFKSLKGDYANKYDVQNIERPFFSVSPKFGYDFFFANKDSIIEHGFIKMGSRRVPVPTYYRNMFMSFNDSDVNILEYNMYKDFLKRSSEVKKQGFSDYVDYMNSQRKLNERLLASKFRSKGIPVYDYYSDFSSGNVKDLVCEVLKYED